ncbi:MAG TPA: DUF3820 family protein [Parapedobacter sp.]|nr:DUF3820 family protein [Parapedobacter sp.]
MAKPTISTPIMTPEETMQRLVTTRMPFGKYKDTLICNLPEAYLVWFHQKGFPKGTIGMLLATMYEIKLNGLEYLLAPLRNKNRM